MSALKNKIGVAVGMGLSAAVGGLAAGPAGAVLAGLGAAIVAWNGYKMEPPREVWTPERREQHRAKAAPFDDSTPPGQRARNRQIDDTETPPDPVLRKEPKKTG